MTLNKVEKELDLLENAELEVAPSGILAPEVYAQLLAIYLYQNDMCNAKFLWKRIPSGVKMGDYELQNMWRVGQCMWRRDWPGVHEALNFEWSNYVAERMNALKERVRERAMSLISEAYSSVDLSVVGSMTGLSLEQARVLVVERGWSLDETMVRPCKSDKEQANTAQASLTEDQLYKLTQFVSFLEN